MATLGRFIAAGSISTNTDTAIVAAPGVGSKIHVYWITITVSVAGTTSRLRVEDGAGGAVLARMATVTADALINLNYATTFKEFPGRPLTDNTALNINTSGGAACTLNYEVCYEVKGY